MRAEADRAKKLWLENKAEAIKNISDKLLDLVSVRGFLGEERAKLTGFAGSSDF
ncbi:MAG: hypothetical protein OXF23_04485 [Candidatus Dadabacteria bacterium]|nr:hypothetical protein [Candidatus Dadabacteria bacterium]